MRRQLIAPSDFRGVFPVPPLARCNDALRTLDFAENDRIVRHITAGGPTRLIYGGNAFLYHVTLSEYEQLLDWLAGLPDEVWAIPSAGPSYGRAMDQAPLLRRHRFPCVMMLPCGDPRDAAGLERGIREFADAAETPLMLYCKEENNFGADREAGLDAIARLVADRLCIAIKYAVVRSDPAEDSYLAGLLKRVDKSMVISGIGERPAVVHLRDWGLPGFTTGSGCIAPASSQSIFDACSRGDYAAAQEMRERFLPLEDFRDSKGPARVLHHATELADIARTGPLPPYQSALGASDLAALAPVAKRLAEVRTAPRRQLDRDVVTSVPLF